MTGHALRGWFVCDGCMRRVPPAAVALWADYEHVLCRSCDRSERLGAPIGPTDSPNRSHERTDVRTDVDRPTHSDEGADRNAHEEPPC